MMLETYKNKSILITGNSGFKGSWLTIWLESLGAEVTGFSLDIPSSPSNYETSNLKDFSNTIFKDIRNLDSLEEAVEQSQPDFIFHLAAQSLVRKSYQSPIDTFSVNAIGSMNVLEASRALKKPVTIIMITSDKAYDNVEWKWGYRENDALGGKDPYSASKGMAELGIRSYFKSFIDQKESFQKLGIARAGNVIGGGDWSADRIIPDCVKSWSLNEKVKIRNPYATRPWQHVLEPLSGYLALGASLETNTDLNGEAYNFGPAADQNYSVSQLINEIKKNWDNVSWEIASEEKAAPPEAGLLKLNCDKALIDLKWYSTLDFEQTVKFTIDWYKNFYEEKSRNMHEFCKQQIDEYTTLAKNKNIYWAVND